MIARRFLMNGPPLTWFDLDYRLLDNLLVITKFVAGLGGEGGVDVGEDVVRTELAMFAAHEI